MTFTEFDNLKEHDLVMWQHPHNDRFLFFLVVSPPQRGKLAVGSVVVCLMGLKEGHSHDYGRGPMCDPKMGWSIVK